MTDKKKRGMSGTIRKSRSGMSECKCNKCGNIFEDSELVPEMEYDYPGAPISTTYLSPCCFAGYKDEW